MDGIIRQSTRENTRTFATVPHGGSWVVISGVISPLIWHITIVTLLVTPLITTHEPPSSPSQNGQWSRGRGSID